MEFEQLQTWTRLVLLLSIPGLMGSALLTVFIVWADRVGWIRPKPMKVTKQEKILEGATDDDFEEINCQLQTELNNKIIERINQVRTDIKARRLQRDQDVSDLLAEQELEISEKRSEFDVAKEIIDYKYRDKIDALKEEVKTEISEMKESLRSLRLVLSSSPALSTTETMTNTRSELECPVCLEEMRPPRRIWQCSDGHAVCDFCRRKPSINSCPTCRKYIVGRSNIAEKLARSVFGGDHQAAAPGRITLTGYREVTTEQVLGSS